MKGLGRAVVVGALLGVLAVGGLVAAAALGVLPGTRKEAEVTANGPTLVALVLPDADGQLTVRTLDRYQRTGDSLSVTEIDPLTSATVPGTSATTLAEAYAFGGGDGLLAAYAAQTGSQPRSGWVVVRPDAWGELMGSKAVSMRLAADIEVFDGKDLYSYPEGPIAVVASETATLMNGAAHLSSSQRAVIRRAVGDALAVVLTRQGAGLAPSLTSGSATGLAPGIESDLTAEEFALRLQGLKSPPLRADRP